MSLTLPPFDPSRNPNVPVHPHAASDGSSRVVYHSGGGVEVVPESPAYVFGKLVLRPLIDGAADCLWRFTRVVQRGALALDAQISRLFSVRFAAAAPTKTQSVVVYRNVDLKVIGTMAHVGVNTRHVSALVKGFIPEDKIALSRNSELNRNFQIFHEMFLGLTHFISGKAADYETYRVNLVEACTAWRYLRADLESILSDLKRNKGASRFSPTSGKRYILTLPGYSKDFRVKTADASLYEIETHYLTKADKRVIPPMASQQEMEDIDEQCRDNPVEVAMLAYLAELGGFLNAFNVDDQFNYQHLRALFGNESMEIFREQIEAVKKNLDSGVERVEDIVARYMQSLQAPVHEEVDKLIHAIYQEQDRIARTLSGVRVNVHVQTRAGLVRSWSVENCNFLFCSTMSSFRVGSPDSVPGEL